MKLILKRMGGKWKTSKYYPKPRYDLVVEPFAGGAGYSTYYDKRAMLFDVDPKVADAWDFVLRGDLDTLPRGLDIGTELDSVAWSHPGAREIVDRACHIGGGVKRVNADGNCVSRWRDVTRASKIASCKKVRELGTEFFKADYRSAPDVEATWFFDPPYQHFASANAKYDAPPIDYAELRDFIMSRRGQIIVCEGAGADWLPFETLRHSRSHVNSCGKARYVEALIYYVER